MCEEPMVAWHRLVNERILIFSGARGFCEVINSNQLIDGGCRYRQFWVVLFSCSDAPMTYLGREGCNDIYPMQQLTLPN